jgi:hypothetical protein
MNGTVKSSENNGTFNVELTHSLDNSMYDLPLTLKTYVKNRWKVVSVKQGDNKKEINTKRDEKGTYVMYQAIPNSSGIEISSI